MTNTIKSQIITVHGSFFYRIDMLRYKIPLFLKKCWFLKAGEISFIPSNSLLGFPKYLINPNKKYILMFRKDSDFCDQSLKSAAI